MSAWQLFPEVAEMNEWAIHLYQSSGFEIVGRRNNYQVDRILSETDALIMRLLLTWKYWYHDFSNTKWCGPSGLCVYSSVRDMILWPCSRTERGTFCSGSRPCNRTVARSPDNIISINNLVRTNVIGQIRSEISKKCCVSSVFISNIQILKLFLWNIYFLFAKY